MRRTEELNSCLLTSEAAASPPGTACDEALHWSAAIHVAFEIFFSLVLALSIKGCARARLGENPPHSPMAGGAEMLGGLGVFALAWS